MYWVKFFISLLLTVALFYFLSVPTESIPFPLGNFMSPYHGFWHNAETGQEPEAQIQLPGLKAEVKVSVDERGVPHIFAQNDIDLAYVQGFITAKDRLWQMDFQSYAAAGRLAEIFPSNLEESLLAYDKQIRRQGMVYAAERSLDFIMQDSASRTLFLAYSEGVNTFINSLQPKDYPIEYKIFNYSPEPWTPLKTALLGKYMANSLASQNYDLAYTRALQIWGEELFNQLYPDWPEVHDPIMTANTRWPFRNAAPSLAPRAYEPDSLLPNFKIDNAPDPDNGSNNWAVAGAKTITGSPMLANDPHLDLNLPSLWYEVQLHTPQQNTYGISLPGAPGIVIGFNDSIAWGLTNAGRDVMDFYRIEFQNASRQHYRFDGNWMIASQRIEAFKLKRGVTVFDTVPYTHLGPVMFDETVEDKPVALAVRWLAHDPSNEFLALFRLNKANNYQEYLDAIKDFQVPAQNFVFASVSGDIALWQQGKFVNLWPGQGKFVMDASEKVYNWNNYIPQEHNPHELNPARNFVSSANQHPTDPRYPYYYHGNFEYYRNRRINKLLTEDDSISVKDMQQFQLDNYSLHAEEILPVMLAAVDTNTLNTTQREIYDMLRFWDRRFEASSQPATIFDIWWGKLYRAIWEDEFKQYDVDLKWPHRYATVRLLSDERQTDFVFFDDKTTETVENRDSLIKRTFFETNETLAEMGSPSRNWRLSKHKAAQVRHLARIAPFGKYNLTVGGGRSILNAIKKTHGPSWRMVVSLDTIPQGYGVYPGGQSGNPGSPQYDQFVEKWEQGDYYSLWRMSHAGDDSREIHNKLVFKP